MAEPKFVREQLEVVWPNMDSKFWLVHTTRAPRGIVKQGNRSKKKFWGDRPIFLSNEKGKQFFFGYYKEGAQVTGPFERAFDAVAWRDEQARVA